MQINEAIDDYLRLIVRTRPWTKQREEELLTPFGDWLYEQPDLSLDLETITPALVQRYGAETKLPVGERDDLERTLGKFWLWAESRGHVRGNPFVMLVAA